MINKKKTINPFVIELVNKLHKIYLTAQHSLIKNISSLVYDLPQIHHIAKNIYWVVKKFPRFLSAITANIDDYKVRMPLVENLFEEHGRMNLNSVHLNSYICFLEQIGIKKNELENFQPEIGVIAYVRSILDLCLHYNYLEGLAAIGFIEDIVHQVSPIITKIAKKNLKNITQIAHFTEHEMLDEQHSKEIYALLIPQNEKEKKLIKRGLMLGAYYHNKLYTDIAESLENNSSSEDKSIIQGMIKDFSIKKMDKSESFYPLARGEAAIKRLELVNKLYNKKSIKNIQSCINLDTTSILELGCGIGILANQLAEIVNPSIRILAIDNSKEQIVLANNIYKSTKSNLDFKILDCHNLISLKEKFDIIYIRWVLIYQDDIHNIIKQCFEKLKSKGYLIIEDNNPIEFGCYSNEYSNIIKTWEEFLKSAFIKAGQTNNLEKFIIDIAQVFSMKLVKKDINQCSLITKETKALFYLGIEESKLMLMKSGMGGKEIDVFVKKLQKLCETKYPIDFVKNFQLIFVKQ